MEDRPWKKEIKDTLQHIPLLDVLQAMLKNDSIFKEVSRLMVVSHETKEKVPCDGHATRT